MNPSTEPIISVRGLRHSYGEGAFVREVLHGVDVDLAPGEIAIIMGHSGSGKTTFLTLVSALRSVQTGSVRVAGQELHGATDAVLTTARREIGFVFQKHNLIGALTARQNVQMALLIDRPADSAAVADSLLARVGLRGHEHKRARELSGGQQQRVAIARALARQPRVIMADEPTASLDAQTGHEIIDFIQTLARTEGCAVMIVTHDSRILDVADRILTLDDGRMIETDANFERLADDLAALFAGLPQVFAYFPEDGPPRLAEYQAQHLQFAAATEALNMRASDYVRLKLKPEAAHRADALQQMLAAIRSLEALLGEFGEHLRSAPADLQRGTGNSLQQALETVLLTAADALRTRDPDDIDILARIASDRSDAMKRLRDAPSTRPGTNEVDEARRNALFTLTNDFARLIYLHGQVAHFLTEMRRRGATLAPNQRQAITLRNDLAELPRLAESVEAFCTPLGATASDLSALQLALEEAVTNVIKHGYADGRPHTFTVELAAGDRRVTVTVTDDAPAYDPLARAEVDTTLSIEQRQIGGLGVHLVKKLMDSVRYERRDGCNVLVFVRTLGRAA